MASQVLNRFTLVEKIGEGAHAEVWRADDPNLNREVAIKLLRPETNKEIAQRFEQEVQAASQLTHGNIVTLYEAGKTDHHSFIVYELIEGVTLRAWLEFVQPSALEVALLISQVADALSYAHEKGIVHRDIKPENILVDICGKPFVTDFGLAQVADKRITTTDITVGTIAYVAPEQSLNRTVSCQADIFALGAVLFEALTGELPFRATTRAEYLAQLTSQDAPSVTEINRTIHVDLAAICKACLERDTAYRYRSAQDLAQDLKKFSCGQTPLFPPISWSRKTIRKMTRARRSLLTSLSVFLLVISLVVVYQIAANNIARAVVDKFMSETPSRLRESVKATPPSTRLVREIRRRLANPNPVQADANLLYAIAELDELSDRETERLVNLVPSATPENSRTVAAALCLADYKTTIRLLHERVSMVGQEEIPFACMAMLVGDIQPVRDAARIDRDQSDRELLIAELMTWDLSPEQWSGCINCQDADAQSAILIAAGESIYANESEKQKVKDLIETTLRDTDNTLVRGSAEYALRKLGASAEEISILGLKKGDNWFTHKTGIVFVRIPVRPTRSPNAARSNQPTSATPFFAATIEVPRSVKEGLLSELDMIEGADSEHHRLDGSVAANHLELFDAIRICNRISELDNRIPYYVQFDGQDTTAWSFDEDSDGYRLPTVEQWRWLAFAHAETDFFFGLPRAARKYAWLVGDEAYQLEGATARPGGHKRPNGFGLFDVYGNVAEYVCNKKTFYVMGGSFHSHYPLQLNSIDCQSIRSPRTGLSAYGMRLICPPRKEE